MTKSTGAWIAGVGLLTSVGDSTAQSVSSVRAGISRYREGAILHRELEPMVLALLPEEALPPLDVDLEGRGLTTRQTRILRLAISPLEEASVGVETPERIPLFLALPEARPERPPPIHDTFLDDLHQQVGGRFERESSRAFTQGRAAGFAALNAALEHLETADFALVGGLDSFLDPYLLDTLAVERRVLGRGIPDGFAPGEGAAFLLLTSAEGRRQFAPAPRVFVERAALAEEPGHRYSDAPLRGDGLAIAIQNAVEEHGEEIAVVLSSLNGESQGAKEWSVALARCGPKLSPSVRHVHPIENFGDPGAALAPILLGLAGGGLFGEPWPGPCLVWCASDHETRGAVVLRSPKVHAPQGFAQE